MKTIDQTYDVVSIENVRPHPRNPRRGDVDLIAESITENGFYGAIVVQRSTGHIIAGNHRWKAARASGATEIAAIFVDVDDDRALRIMLADNRSSDSASNDEAALDALLRDLADTPLQLDGTLFEIEDLDDEEKEDKNTEIPEQLVTAYADFYIRLADMIESEHVPAYTREASIVHFLRHKHGIAEYPRSGSNGFIGSHRLSVLGDKTSLLDGLRDPKSSRSRIAVTSGVVNENVTNASLAIHGSRQPLDFPVDLAQSLINEFTPSGGAVLDPCHGWGGRGVGFLLSHAGRYLGFDPAPETNARVAQMLTAYSLYVDGKSWEVVCSPFEDGIVDSGAFHFALTSPPYYDTERYEGGEQSHERYHSYEEWLAGFYRPMIEKVFRALVPGGTFALQVGSQSYPLAKDGEKIGKLEGFTIDRRRGTGMKNSFNKTEDDAGEVILILRKPS